jgi:hypothetical protein
MFKTDKIIQKAKEGSKFHLWLLNTTLQRMIPFNKPHGITVRSLSDYSLQTYYPYKTKNLNHIKGLHACGLATLSEFTTGLLLTFILDPKRYRLIMHSMNVEYHYQGKTDAIADYTITKEWLEKEVLIPLNTDEKVLVETKVQTKDKNGEVLCTAQINWHIKNWKKVKTKL